MEDEEEAIILLLLRRRRPARIWSREHFLLRTERGEYHRTFLYLKDNRDDDLFWNYLRMSYRTFDILWKGWLLKIWNQHRSTTVRPLSQNKILHFRETETGDNSWNLRIHNSTKVLTLICRTCAREWTNSFPAHVCEPRARRPMRHARPMSQGKVK